MSVVENEESIIYNNLYDENIHLITKYEPKVGIFKYLDYDLNLNERKLKFKNYRFILCEDCNQEINRSNFVCLNCYSKEKTDVNEQNRMNHGICRLCFKSNSSNSFCY